MKKIDRYLKIVALQDRIRHTDNELANIIDDLEEITGKNHYTVGVDKLGEDFFEWLASLNKEKELTYKEIFPNQQD